MTRGSAHSTAEHQNYLTPAIPADTKASANFRIGKPLGPQQPSVLASSLRKDRIHLVGNMKIWPGERAVDRRSKKIVAQC